MQRCIGPDANVINYCSNMMSKVKLPQIGIQLTLEIFELYFLHTNIRQRVYFSNLPTLQIRLRRPRSGHLFYVFPHTSCRQLC